VIQISGMQPFKSRFAQTRDTRRSATKDLHMRH